MSKQNITLAQSVAEALRHEIVEGIRTPGERLLEMDIAHELAVSQNTVRDALRILQADGWVIKRPRLGVYVRKFTAEEAKEIYALIIALEKISIVWAMENITKAQIGDLRRLIAQSQRQADEKDTRGAVETLFEFHKRLIQYANRPLTIDILDRLYNHLRMLEAIRLMRSPRNPTELAAQIAAHEQMLKRIESGDHDGVIATLDKQMTTYRDLLLPILQDKPAYPR